MTGVVWFYNNIPNIKTDYPTEIMERKVSLPEMVKNIVYILVHIRIDTKTIK